MAHKKGGGSSRNGRDSQSQRLGVKKFGGERVLIREHPGSPARYSHQARSQRRCRQGFHLVCHRRWCGSL